MALKDAVGLLNQPEKAQDEAFLRSLTAVYHGRSNEECLAANLVKNAMLQAGNDRDAAQKLADRLSHEFRDLYQIAPPWTVSHMVLHADSSPSF